MKRKAAAAALLAFVAAACVHHTPRATVLGGKRVGLGELKGDVDVKAVLKDALAERFELDAPNPELHLHVDATMSAFDEPVVSPALNPQPQMLPLYRRVQTLRATLRLVNDGTGEVVALGVYELMEKGPERPRDTRAGEEMGIILARRAVQLFIEQNKL